MIWVETQGEFERYVKAALEQDVVALDTEFVWTHTYLPNLGLIQMNWTGSDAILIDPLAVNDPALFGELLASERVTKVFHEASSDLPILVRWCGGQVLPQGIFDTRIASGFVGLTVSVSLSKLIQHFFNVTLAKTETRTDWMRRPLTAKQLEYAADDVTYMPGLHDKLLALLSEKGNLDYFLEEMGQFHSPEYYASAPEEKAWKHFSHFSGSPDFKIICELALWREDFARRHNIAKSHVLSDEQLLLLASKKPRTQAELIRQTSMWPKLAVHYGNAILAALQNAMRSTREFHVFIPQKTLDITVYKKRCERVLSLIKKRAENRSIDSILLGTRKDAESFVDATSMPDASVPESHKLLSGWRGELLGDTLSTIFTNTK